MLKNESTVEQRNLVHSLKIHFFVVSSSKYKNHHQLQCLLSTEQEE